MGSANLDLVFRTERFPSPGETLLGGPFASFPGGKGANQAVAAGNLGGAVSFVGCIGEDAFGKVLEQSLKESGVDVTHLYRTSNAATGTAAILVDQSGANEIIVAPGANLELTAEQVEDALQGVKPHDLVLVQLEISDDAVAAASRFGTLFLDPAPARHVSSQVFERTFALTPNETEAEFLTGIRPCDADSCEEAAKALLALGVKHVVITLGEKGCYWTSGERSLFVRAREVRALDTVAAGDAFNGALAWAFAEYGDWANALQQANAAAAIAVTRHGAQTSMPCRLELDAFLAL